MSATLAAPRLAVVGTGWWATQFLIPGLLRYRGAQLVALGDSDPRRLAAAGEAFGIAQLFDDIEDLITKVPLDGVVVATSNAAHYGVARTALESGLHVMIEKPMVLHAWQAWDLVERARRHHVQLQVGYPAHFDDSARRLRVALHDGAIGEIAQITGVYSSVAESFYRGRPQDYDLVYHYPVTGPMPASYADPLVAGGGHGQIQLTHLVAMMLWATGGRAREVSAFMESADLAVDLFDAIAFRLDNAAVGVIGGGGSHRAGERCEQRLCYFGRQGYATQDFVDGTVRIVHRDGSLEEVPSSLDASRRRASTVRGFADLIAGRGPNLAPGEAGAKAVELLEAAYRSAAEGRHVEVSTLSTPRDRRT